MLLTFCIVFDIVSHGIWIKPPEEEHWNGAGSR